ncbi:Histone deacetylase complex subunit [Umbelopsis sp. WA50703]
MQRRGRSANGSRRRRQPVAQAQSSSEDESSDAGSITRCICGEIHNEGLMVQCDKCEVWQHCSCIGLLEQDIPEQYYCEECRPENHSWIKLGNGRNKRQYHPDGNAEKRHQPKKRMTNNSREADVPLADILLSRAFVNGEESSHAAPMDENPMHEEKEPELILPPIVEGIEEAVKRRSRRSVEEAQQAAATAAAATAAAAAAAAAAAKRSRSHSMEDEKPAIEKDNGDIAQDESDNEVKAKRPRRAGPGNTTKASSEPKKPAASKKPPARKPAVKRARNARSRTSTPQLSDTESLPPVPPQPEKTVDEPSTPARVRYPSAKMSLWEMNRRAKQILEYISSVQVDMANKSSMPKPTSDDAAAAAEAPVVEAPASPASSVSSATTLPLDAVQSSTTDANQSNHTDAAEQTSLEIMDRLTRELIKFQSKFTTSYHAHKRLHTPDQSTPATITSNNGNADITVSISSPTTVSNG